MDRREQEIQDELRERTADTKAPETLEPEHIRRMLEEKEQGLEYTKKRKNRVWKMCVLAAACTAVVSLAVWRIPGVHRSLPGLDNIGMSDTGSTDGFGKSARKKELDGGKSEAIVCAEDYVQIYDYIKAYQEARKNSYTDEPYMEYEEFYAEAGNGDTGGSRESAAAEDGAAVYDLNDSAQAGAADTAAGETVESYSETNVRQEGVDEADIVKTDGRYLYVLEDNNKEIAVVDTQEQKLKKTASINVEDKGTDCYICEFYVVPDTKKLVLLCSVDSQFMTELYPDYEGTGTAGSTAAVTYDIQDPSHPKEEGIVDQSGNYQSSRMSDGYLYLFSEWGLNLKDHMEAADYIPRINGENMEAEKICLPPGKEAYWYEIITVVDPENPREVKDSIALFSKGGQIYVSNENIYYYETEWEYGRDTAECATTIRKIGYKDGELKARVQGEFGGYLNDSFSIDEYEGNLRVVTTEGETNSVYVLDEELKKIGAIEGLAKEERVYSARFMGDVGYFVTFRETDPLFSVDLSDPEKPEIVSELKIPGFSDYLHFYGEDQLLGIGMNVEEETQITDGVKLSMFDISDKMDVKEKDTFVLENVYGADVSYDYKAALIDPDRNIIGFSGDSMGGKRYFLFKYDKEGGFICNMEEEINGNDMSGTRGVYVEETLYVVQGNIIEAYSLKDYEKVDDLIL